MNDFFKKLISSPTVLPHYFKIPNQNTPDPASLEGSFETRKHYFSLRVNEMYLKESRQWFSQIEPMVISITEYMYNQQFVSNPFVVGSTLLKDKMKGEGEGMVFRDTRVAGLHPYAGGRFIINIALFRNETENYLNKTMKFLESVTGVFNDNIAGMLKSFTKVSDVIVSGIEELVNTDKTKPLFGIRKEFDPDAGEAFEPGYYAMIDKSNNNWDAADFSVDKNNRLLYKNNPFREDEYILFSITKTTERNDYMALPIYKQYDEIRAYAQGIPEVSESEKMKIKEMLRVLNFEMNRSADLTTADAERLIDQFFEELKKMVDRKFNWGAAKQLEKNFWSEMDEKITNL
ncbi:hypothetical protein A4D02_15965 [Niastella koreensis]|uniref:Uncharacterized protein n=2 Tax=Niastella koreensis TaxID=354356 RepID=G8TPF7_NIAKG|nr:hypothetical protein [Niastella koreensis]AEV97778.1 hypothetical protein Niako_1407 [Niastella koreensis GR20-10]OQP40410.1 hypothetical protein A4D02_15965 [Niastella koreensis]